MALAAVAAAAALLLPDAVVPSALLLLPVSGFFLVRSNSSNIEAPSPFFVFGGVQEFALNGELVRALPADGCDSLTLNATGKVLWMEPYRCSIESQTKQNNTTQYNTSNNTTREAKRDSARAGGRGSVRSRELACVYALLLAQPKSVIVLLPAVWPP